MARRTTSASYPATYLRYVPNGDHGLDDTDAVEGAVAFVGMLREGRQRPAFVCV